MKTIADYIATATPQTGWKVQVTGDQSAYHTTPADTDSVYEYDGTGWYQVQKQNGTDESAGNLTFASRKGRTADDNGSNGVHLISICRLRLGGMQTACNDQASHSREDAGEHKHHNLRFMHGNA